MASAGPEATAAGPAVADPGLGRTKDDSDRPEPATESLKPGPDRAGSTSELPGRAPDGPEPTSELPEPDADGPGSRFEPREQAAGPSYPYGDCPAPARAFPGSDSDGPQPASELPEPDPHRLASAPGLPQAEPGLLRQCRLLPEPRWATRASRISFSTSSSDTSMTSWAPSFAFCRAACRARNFDIGRTIRK